MDKEGGGYYYFLNMTKALDDRKGSRSNDDLDHILGKKDRNWLHFLDMVNYHDSDRIWLNFLGEIRSLDQIFPDPFLR